MLIRYMLVFLQRINLDIQFSLSIADIVAYIYHIDKFSKVLICLKRK
jgi:hypothetical protein